MGNQVRTRCRWPTMLESTRRKKSKKPLRGYFCPLTTGGLISVRPGSLDSKRTHERVDVQGLRGQASVYCDRGSTERSTDFAGRGGKDTVCQPHWCSCAFRSRQMAWRSYLNRAAYASRMARTSSTIGSCHVMLGLQEFFRGTNDRGLIASRPAHVFNVTADGRVCDVRAVPGE